MTYMAAFAAKNNVLEPYGSTIELCQLFVFKVEPCDSSLELYVPVWNNAVPTCNHMVAFENTSTAYA